MSGERFPVVNGFEPGYSSDGPAPEARPHGPWLVEAATGETYCGECLLLRRYIELFGATCRRRPRPTS